MRRVASSKRRTEAVPLDGANEHHRWFAFVGGGLSIGCVEFGEIVSADVSTKRFKFGVGKVRNEGCKTLRVEQFLADGSTVGGHDALFIAVDHAVEPLRQKALGVASK